MPRSLLHRSLTCAAAPLLAQKRESDDPLACLRTEPFDAVAFDELIDAADDALATQLVAGGVIQKMSWII